MCFLCFKKYGHVANEVGKHISKIWEKNVFIEAERLIFLVQLKTGLSLAYRSFVHVE